MPAARAAGPKPDSALPPGVEAVVNNVPIPRIDVDEAIKTSGQPDTPALRAQVKQNLIIQQLIEQAADKADYGVRPEVNKVVMRARTIASTDLYLHEMARPQPVTDAQVKAHYDQIVGTAAPFQYRAEVIAVRSPAEANEIVAELKKGTAFDALARKFNTTPNGGIAEWADLHTPVAEGNTAGVPVPVAQAMTTLQPGAISAPVRVGDAFAFVTLDEKRKTVVPTFDAAKNVLRQQLEAQADQRAMAALVEKLASQATIQQ